MTNFTGGLTQQVFIIDNAIHPCAIVYHRKYTVQGPRAIYMPSSTQLTALPPSHPLCQLCLAAYTVPLLVPKHCSGVFRSRETPDWRVWCLMVPGSKPVTSKRSVGIEAQHVQKRLRPRKSNKVPESKPATSNLMSKKVGSKPAIEVVQAKKDTGIEARHVQQGLRSHRSRKVLGSKPATSK
jgi:hypothetical protein